MDATGTHRRCSWGCAATACGGRSSSRPRAPERVQGIVAFAAGVPDPRAAAPVEGPVDFDEELPTDEGWAKVNQHSYRRDYAGFARFFFAEITSEPHSTKQIEDAVDWALDGSVESMIADTRAGLLDPRPSRRPAAPSAARWCSSTARRTPASRSPALAAWPS